MTTWTMDQVRQAQGLRARLAVDDSLIARDPDGVQQHAADEMVKALTAMAHPFGVELHREDFEVQWVRDDSTPWQVTGEMRWWPTTHTVELRGGHLDGQRYTVKRIGDPLRVPRPATTPWWVEDASTASAATTEMIDTYEIAGWREGERVWVYEAK